MRPIIGIPCFAATRSATLRPIYGNNRAYVRAIERAGGAALLIPPYESEDALRDAHGLLDGLLLTGGVDVDPALYGEERSALCDEPEPERDRSESALTRWALDQGMPLLAICRGMQLLNVVCGGSLFQDIAGQRPNSQQHDFGERPREYRAHEALVAAGSQLARVLGGERVAVNSLHHQAVNRLGARLTAVAWAEDGVVEGMEMEGRPFALAVQYHPEELAATDSACQRLFAAFVAACAAGRVHAS